MKSFTQINGRTTLIDAVKETGLSSTDYKIKMTEWDVGRLARNVCTKERA
jgi:hypothetical protein